MNKINLEKIKTFKKEKVLLRASFDVPLKGNKIESDFRLKESLETINFLKKKKSIIIIISHLGRNKSDTLKPVFLYLKKIYKKDIFFDPKTFLSWNEKKQKQISQKIEKLKEGQILILDNLRQNKNEKENDKNFSKSLKKIADFYINDAFSVSHRKHSSVFSLASLFEKEKRFLGFSFEKELKNLNISISLLNKKESLFFLGGSKISSKIIFLEKNLKKFSKIILGGAVLNTFYFLKGFETGKSLIEKEVKISKKVLNSKKIILPEIVLVKNSKGKILEKNILEIKKDESIFDVSPKCFSKKDFENFDFIFFNGPFGFYEKGFTKGTEKIISSISPKSFFLLGGGNSTSFIFNKKLNNKVDFISTGGGASIEFLQKETLPVLRFFK